MQIQKKIGGFVIALAGLLVGCLFCAVFFFCAPVQAQEENSAGEKIRVVLTNYDDTGYVNVSGEEITGYYVDYLHEIAKHTGWEYDIRVVPDERELEAIIDGKDFDIMLGVDYTEERERTMFEYPEADIGMRHLVVAASKTHPILVSNDISLLQGLKVGVTETDRNQSLKDKFVSYCYSNGIKCREDVQGSFPQGVTLVNISEEKRFEMVENGQIDAVLCSDSKALANELFVVADFGKTAIYPVVPKGDRHLLDELNDVLTSMEQVDSGYSQRLYQKYFASNAVNVLSFNEEELKYLTKNREYRVALWGDCAPYGYLNDSGEWSGISVEIFNEISRMTDGRITFCIEGYDSSQEAAEAFQNGGAEILGQSFASVNAALRSGDRSTSYYSDRFYMYRNKNYSMGMEEARIIIKQDFPESILLELGVKDPDSVIRVKNTAEALRAVNGGEADITFALQNVADYYINYYQMNKISDIPLQVNDVSFCCIFDSSVDPVARNIFNKCISHLDRGNLNRRITEYILTDHKEFTLVDYIKANWGSVALVGIIFMAIAIALLVVVVITISNKTKRIYRMLYQDDITGGDSYLKFEENVGRLLEERNGPCYILFADINSFKYINDVYGYNTGNCVLCAVEGFMRKLAGGYPVARMYADHFVAVRPFQGKEELEKQLRYLLQEFDEESRGKFKDFNVLLKIGVYLWEPQTEREIRQLVNFANYAAGSIVNSSKSEYCFYSMEMHDKIVQQQRIEKDMHRAMTEGEFIVFYQPKYDIVTNEVIGAEALVRWNHKERGLIAPGAFVPIFENNRFIIEVDFCVFEQVCALLAARIKQGKKLYPISCNFSRLHFPQKDFVDRLTQIVDKYQVPAGYLEIEITETVATSDFDLLIGTVRNLKEKGFQISIDDFGSGYSCIQLLYKLPIDVLKLDRVFVCEQGSNRTEEDIHRSIITICRNHGIRVICEGVETKQQKEYIESYGCRYVQGFLYSKPVKEQDFLAMLDKV